MIRINCNRNIHQFMYNKFPELLGKCLVSKVKSLKKDRVNYLNSLLKEEFNIEDIYQLISLFIKHLKINNYQNKDYYISVEDVLVNNIKLESIIRTVDYGNSKFPQCNLFNTSLIFVNNNLEALYKYSYLGVN